MELTSAPLHKEQVPWRGLLLTALLLTYCNSSTTAQVTAEAIPPHVAEGKDVLLLVHTWPAPVLTFAWFKGELWDERFKIFQFRISNNTIERGVAYTGRETLYLNGSMLFRNVIQHDTGNYTLAVAYENYDIGGITVQFHVHQTLTLPFIEVTNTTVKELDSVFLTCLSKNTGISISWFLNDQSLELTDRMKLSQNNSTLHIDHVRREDSGDYQCEIYHPLSSKRSDPIHVGIKKPVTLPVIQVTNITVKELDSVDLTCSSNNTGISISWLFNGQSLELTKKMKLSQNNRTLHIAPLMSENSGDYQCEVSSPAISKRSDPIQLDIREHVTPPFIQVTNTTVKELDSVVLTCSSMYTGMSISWFFNGQSLEITDRMKLSQNNRTLSIESVRREDSGDYQCEVSNPFRSKRSDPIQLDITEHVTPPFIQVTNTTVKELDSVVLTCFSNNTGISISWLFNGQSLELTDRMKLSQNNSILTIDPVMKEDSGDYQCEVSSPVISKRSDPIRLNIIEHVTPPFIQVTNTTVKELDSVTLTCLSNNTGISISWLFNGQSLELTDRMKLSQNNSILTIDPVMKEDSGDYQCEVSNPVISKRSDPIRLNIIELVTPPFIQVTNTTVKDLDSVVLTCVSNNTGTSISWLFNGQSLRLTDRMKLSQNNSILTIDPVMKEDSGDYQCEVSSPAISKRSDPIRLNIIEPVTPSFIHVTNPRVKELDSVFLTCSSKDTGISISWFFNGQSLELTDRMKLSQNNSTLSIEPVRREDSGDYQCQVSNPVSSKRSDPIRLDIIANPTQGSSDHSWGVTASIVAGSVVAVNLISSMMYFIYFRKSHG